MHLCIVEDQQVKNFLPLTHLNPITDLRCGCTSLLERILNVIPAKSVSLLVRPYLVDYLNELYSSFHINSLPNEDILFINGRVLADVSLLKFAKNLGKKECIAVNGFDIVAAYVKKENANIIAYSVTDNGFSFDEFASLPSKNIDCVVAKYPWDLVHNNAKYITEDFKKFKPSKKIAGKIYPGTYLLNKKNIVIGKGSSIKPGVVIDAEHGPVIIGKNVTIMPNAVIEGPVYIGDSSIIKVGAKIYPGTSIGSECRIGGEVTRSIFQSYSNKAHDGFVGDSYIGSWVNLGADTNTSNLKNTYGNVTVQINGKQIDSRLQFVGLTMGDHSKSGINVMFNTGTAVGISCNVYGADLPPKYLPSFIWGSADTQTEFDIEKSLEIAQRMMERRKMIMSQAYKQIMRHIFTLTSKERKQWLKK